MVSEQNHSSPWPILAQGLFNDKQGEPLFDVRMDILMTVTAALPVKRVCSVFAIWCEMVQHNTRSVAVIEFDALLHHIRHVSKLKVAVLPFGIRGDEVLCPHVF